MGPAQHDEVIDARRATIGPMLDVVRVDHVRSSIVPGEVASGGVNVAGA